MKFNSLTAAAAALTLVSFASAQQVYGGPGERKASTVFVFTDSGAAVAASVAYGQPEWKDDYNNLDGMLAMVQGKSNRLGKDWWTTLSTATALEINGATLPAGTWLLGIHVDMKHNFSLMAFDAATAMKNKWMPWDGDKWTGGIKLPMTFEKDAMKSAPKKHMEMALETNKDMMGSFAIHWGPHALTAKVNFSPKPAMTEASADKEMKGDHGKDHDKKGEHDKKD